MSLNETPSANRIHIGFFGRRNAGKSSLVNAVTGQELAVVSDIKGTTTDPVTKAMELLPLGPVVIIDTPGIDDEGELGNKRVQKAKQMLNRTDIAVLVVDAAVGFTEADGQLLAIIKEKAIPYLVAYNKADTLAAKTAAWEEAGRRYSAEWEREPHSILVSAGTGENIHELKERIARLAQTAKQEKKLVGDLLKPGDLVVLVIPIDESAPKGRLILPQQQVLRELLDVGAIGVTVRETELAEALGRLGQAPAMVITDSQVFGMVSKLVPKQVPLTSFSILMARYKGFLDTAVRGAAAIDTLREGNQVLVAEGCTHHRQCNDIGTVKLPRWLQEYCGKKISIQTCSGTEFREDLSEFSLIIHCGGCMLNDREMGYRMKCALDQGIPFTNYGIAIAYMNGILERSLGVLPEVQKLLNPHR